MEGPKVDKITFTVALAVIVAFVVPIIVWQEGAKEVVGVLFGFATGELGFSFLWFTIAAFGILMYFALGKYGNVRFGGPDARPQFSTASWIAMLFCAGIGASVMYWGTIEWAYYYSSPPWQIEPKSHTAAEWASMYGLFHWGFTAWAVYCIPTLPLAYLLWNRKQGVLRLSAACSGVIGDKTAKGPIGKLIDVLFMFGLIGGVGTSLGLGTPMLSAGLADLFNIGEEGRNAFAFGQVKVLDLVVVGIWTAIFGYSVYSGLEKGIKVLSDINLYLIVAILAFVFLFGPTRFMIDTFTQAVGLLAQNFIQMSFYTDPMVKSQFPQWWTIFYWAWWVAYAPFMGLFVARISYGRTIKQLVTIEILGGSFGCWIFFAIFGNTAMHMDLYPEMYPQLAEWIATRLPSFEGDATIAGLVTGGQAADAIVAMVTNVTSIGAVGYVTLIVFVVLAFIFGATTFDSSAFTLASVATEPQEDPNTEPATWHRLTWGILLAVVALALMSLGGLKPLQTASRGRRPAVDGRVGHYGHFLQQMAKAGFPGIAGR